MVLTEDLLSSMDGVDNYPEKSSTSNCTDKSGSPEKYASLSLEQSTSRSPEQFMSECPVPSTSSAHANNSVQWVVGYFEDKNVCSIIPSNWLLNEHGCWYSKWPNSYKATIKARITKASKPAKTWKYYAVQIIKKYDTYDEAEKETLLQSPISDQDNFGRGKRKKLYNIRQNDFFGYDSDDADENTDEILNSCLVLNKNNSLSNSTINSTKQDNQDLPSSVCPVFECISRINKRLGHLKELLISGGLYKEEEKKFDNAFFSLFPMNEINDILSIESRIVNYPEFAEKFTFFISSFNCTDVKDFVHQILIRLFTNNLASNCTWFGFKGKIELKSLKMIRIMNDFSSATIKGHTDAVFKSCVRVWFKHGKKRFSRELKRKSRALNI